MKIGRRANWLTVAAVLAALLIGLALMRGEAVEATDNAWAHDTLPYYSHADLRARWRATSARRIESFTLRDQRNRPFDERWFAQGPTVVSFFFSQCATVCPVSMDLLVHLHRRLGDAAPNMLSISVTPLLDTPPVLAAFGRRFDLPGNWRLATGVPREVYRLAREQMFTDIETLGPGGEPMHTERALLVDRQGRIRGIYEVTRAVELQRLYHDLEQLRIQG